MEGAAQGSRLRAGASAVHTNAGLRAWRAHWLRCRRQLQHHGTRRRPRLTRGKRAPPCQQARRCAG
eukprot:scaffold60780_cov63-Phaeocystis_antarctica.AAC.2